MSKYVVVEDAERRDAVGAIIQRRESDAEVFDQRTSPDIWLQLLGISFGHVSQEAFHGGDLAEALDDLAAKALGWSEAIRKAPPRPIA